MAPQHLLEDGDRPDRGRRLQQRHDLGVENVGERIGTTSLARNLLLRRQPGILLDAIGRGHADRRLRRRDGRRVGLPELHEKPYLVIGYVAAGHKVIPPIGKTTGIPGRPRSRDDARRDRTFGSKLRSGYALPASQAEAVLILIVATLSP